MTQLQQSRQFVFVDCLTKLLFHLWRDEEERCAGSTVSRGRDGSKLTFSVDRYICNLNKFSPVILKMAEHADILLFVIQCREGRREKGRGRREARVEEGGRLHDY